MVRSQSPRRSSHGWSLLLWCLLTAAPGLTRAQAAPQDPAPAPAAPPAPVAAPAPATGAAPAVAPSPAAAPPAAAPAAAAPLPIPQAPVARVGALPAALEEELEFALGALVEAASVQAAFMAGARGALFYDGRQQLLVFRRTGESRAFPYVPSSEPREHQLAEEVAQWLLAAPPGPAQVAPAPPAAPVAPGTYGPGPVYAQGAPTWGAPAVVRLAPVRPGRDWRQTRVALRQARPWRLRLSLLSLAAPRDADGNGPSYGVDSELIVFPGVGGEVTASRYLSPLFRFDLQFTLAFVAGSWDVDSSVEGSLGGAIVVTGRGRTRLGGGLGLDLLLAREPELYSEDDFGWFSTRVNMIGEIAWTSASGYGVALQLRPTFTYIPYAKRFHPGLSFSVGFEFGVGGSAPVEEPPAADL